MRKALVLGAVAAACLSSACGGGKGAHKPKAETSFEQAVKSARDVSRRDFPPTRGRTLQEIADHVAAGLQVGLATSVLTPGTNRLAFGLIDAKRALVYGKSALYVAPTPKDMARGPLPAPLDSLEVKPSFRSRTAANDPDAAKAVYEARVPLHEPGQYAVLVATKIGGRLIGGPTRVTVARRSPVPALGHRAPVISTPTVASVGGDISKIDTRMPPDDMHSVDFKDVIGKRPVALLFATPRLCQSRVCGPVVDVAEQMKAAYGRRMVFIHQEVYVDNDVSKGLRPQLEAFPPKE